MRLLAQAECALLAEGNRNSGCNPASARRAGNVCGRPPKHAPFQVDHPVSGMQQVQKDLRKKGISLNQVASWYSVDHNGYKTRGMTMTPFKHQLEIEGTIVDSQGNRAGMFNRILNTKTGVVEHSEMKLLPQHRGKGIATDMLSRAVPAYQKAGFKQVQVAAQSKGAYAWALLGFHTTETHVGYMKLFKEQMARDFLPKHFKGAELEEAIKATDKLKHIWDIARFRIGGRKVGKEFLLSGGKVWLGHMNLQPGSRSMRVFKAYMRKKGIRI